MMPAEYWQKRAERNLLVAERQGSELIRKLTDFYADASRQIQ
jgi:hypothetical protein